MLCIIMAFFSVAVGIMVYSFGIEDGLILTQYLGVAIIPVGCITFFMLNLILTCFAEIVDNTAKTAKETKETKEMLDTKLKEIEDEIKKVKLGLEFRNGGNNY